MLVPKSQWPFLVIVCSVLSAENEVNPRYDSGRTHPYHPKLRPPFLPAYTSGYVSGKVSRVEGESLPVGSGRRHGTCQVRAERGSRPPRKRPNSISVVPDVATGFAWECGNCPPARGSVKHHRVYVVAEGLRIFNSPISSIIAPHNSGFKGSSPILSGCSIVSLARPLTSVIGKLYFIN